MAKVYKFYSFDPNGYWKAPLVDHYLYFSKFTDFNDPYEFYFKYDLTGTLKEKRDGLSHLGDFSKKSEAQIDAYLANLNLDFAFSNMMKFFDNFGVTCFSKKATEMLMWSHYSKGHSGFCLEFDTEILSSCSIGEDILMWTDVNYVPSIPRFSIFHNPTFDQFLKHKSTAWSYEDEIRAYRVASNFYFKPECITGAIFGLKSHGTKKDSPAWQDLQELKSLIQGNLPHILGNLMVANKDKNNFGIVLKPVNIGWIS